MTAFKGRTRKCGEADARRRLARAREFFEIAELAMSEQDPGDHSYVYASAAASLAVLAGIAASDSACCMALGECSRADGHDEAAQLIRTITPGGDDAAKDLAVLIGLKDRAQYGAMALGGQDLKRLMRRAESLLDFADRVIRR